MDDADRAADYQARQIEEALADHQAQHPAAAGPGRETCADCGDPIPVARRQSVRGCTRCCTCQQMVDRRHWLIFL